MIKQLSMEKKEELKVANLHSFAQKWYALQRKHFVN